MMKSTVQGVAIVASTVIFIGVAAWVSAERSDPQFSTFADDTGTVGTINVAGSIDSDNPFFQSLGTNGRTCATCHRAADGWTVTPAHLRERFAASRGLDPIFSSNDGSHCEGAKPTSSLAQRRAASSLLLTKGLIRVGLTVPFDAEFTVAAVHDPHGCGGPLENVMVLSSTNLQFLSRVMSDGREMKSGRSILDESQEPSESRHSRPRASVVDANDGGNRCDCLVRTGPLHGASDRSRRRHALRSRASSRPGGVVAPAILHWHQ
jgi:hypothetical protein